MTLVSNSERRSCFGVFGFGPWRSWIQIQATLLETPQNPENRILFASLWEFFGIARPFQLLAPRPDFSQVWQYLRPFPGCFKSTQVRKIVIQRDAPGMKMIDTKHISGAVKLGNVFWSHRLGQEESVASTFSQVPKTVAGFFFPILMHPVFDCHSLALCSPQFPKANRSFHLLVKALGSLLVVPQGDHQLYFQDPSYVSPRILVVPSRILSRDPNLSAQHQTAVEPSPIFLEKSTDG